MIGRLNLVWRQDICSLFIQKRGQNFLLVCYTPVLEEETKIYTCQTYLRYYMEVIQSFTEGRVSPTLFGENAWCSILNCPSKDRRQYVLHTSRLPQIALCARQGIGEATGYWQRARSMVRVVSIGCSDLFNGAGTRLFIGDQRRLQARCADHQAFQSLFIAFKCITRSYRCQKAIQMRFPLVFNLPSQRVTFRFRLYRQYRGVDVLINARGLAIRRDGRMGYRVSFTWSVALVFLALLLVPWDACIILCALYCLKQLLTRLTTLLTCGFIYVRRRSGYIFHNFSFHC